MAHCTLRETGIAAARRAGIVAGLSLVLLASLVTFPAALPWMIACWLLWHSVLVAVGRPGWFPLAACLAVLVIKNVVPWLPELLGLVILVGLLASLRLIWRSKNRAAGP